MPETKIRDPPIVRAAYSDKKENGFKCAGYSHARACMNFRIRPGREQKGEKIWLADMEAVPMAAEEVSKDALGPKEAVLAVEVSRRTGVLMVARAAADVLFEAVRTGTITKRTKVSAVAASLIGVRMSLRISKAKASAAAGVRLRVAADGTPTIMTNSV